MGPTPSASSPGSTTTTSRSPYGTCHSHPLRLGHQMRPLEQRVNAMLDEITGYEDLDYPIPLPEHRRFHRSYPPLCSPPALLYVPELLTGQILGRAVCDRGYSKRGVGEGRLEFKWNRKCFRTAPWIQILDDPAAERLLF